ncbi:MAG: DoxX family protein [Actinomycetes bacterium]
MHLTHNILVMLLALIFIIAGLSKLAGSPKGLSGTRDLGVKDLIARAVGALEGIAALGLIFGLRYPDSLFTWLATAFLWCSMAGSIYLHSRAKKLAVAFPPFLLITLLSIVLVTV